VDADTGIGNLIKYQIINVTVEDEDFTDKFGITVDPDKNAIVR
jgi:hypothetical protein